MLNELGHALTKLTWAEMDEISVYIADYVNGFIKNGEEIGPRLISDMLVEIGDGILKDAKAKSGETQ